MQQTDAISLIKNGVDTTLPQHWADLGCGGGTFTLALAALLPGGSKITAIDQKKQNLTGRIIDFSQADFVKDDLHFSADGILMANSIHFVKDKTPLIRKLEERFTGSPKFLIVEYDSRRSGPWVPYPFPYDDFNRFFEALGYKTKKLAEYPSSFGGRMYSAVAVK